MRRIKRMLSVGLSAVLLAVGAAAFSACDTSSAGENSEITVYMPDGAPSLVFAKMMADDTEDDGFTYLVVAPNVIKSKVSGKNEENNADICVLPALAASALLGNGDTYQMLGVVTHGNLYLIAKDGEEITADGLDCLIGKTVGVLQIADVPGLTWKSILRENDVAYQEVRGVDEAAADKVNLLGLTGAGDVGALSGVDVYLLAEPAVSAKVKTLGYSIVGDLQTLYGGENGYPQAVLVAKKALTETRASTLQTFAQSLRASIHALPNMSGAEIAEAIYAHLEDGEYTSTLSAAALQPATLARCGVRFATAKESKQSFAEYLNRINRVNGGKTGTVSDAFFCGLDF